MTFTMLSIITFALIIIVGLSGKSSVGKSLLFESVVLVTGHQLLSSSSSTGGDSGVGRFQTGSKNTVSRIKYSYTPMLVYNTY